MSKLSPFGGREHYAGSVCGGLDQLAADLADLIQAEADRIQEQGGHLHGISPLAVRLNLAEEAQTLLELAVRGDFCRTKICPCCGKDQPRTHYACAKKPNGEREPR